MQRLRLPVAILLTVLLLGGCAARSYQVHPGAVDEFDSRTYDAILSFQAGLDQAKVEYAQGNLPLSSRKIINRAGDLYNVLSDSHRVYRTWKQTGEKPEGVEVSNLDELAAKIKALIPKIRKLIADIQTLLKPAPNLISQQLQWRVA